MGQVLEGQGQGRGAAERARGLQAGLGAMTQPRESAAGHSWEVLGQGEQMPRAIPLQHWGHSQKLSPSWGGCPQVTPTAGG